MREILHINMWKVYEIINFYLLNDNNIYLYHLRKVVAQ